MRELAIAFALLAPGMLCGQQQTGAPAGIPVPQAPATHQPPADGTIDRAESRVFRVRVLDGRNGAPLQNVHVQLWYDEPAGSGYTLATDGGGYGLMPQPVGEPVRLLVRVEDYTDCRRSLPSSDGPVAYSLSAIAGKGVAVENGCGRVSIRTQPGELLLFARPLKWYENLNRTPGSAQ